MLAYIYRLIRDFEHEHSIHPNLLYINRFHFEHLKSAFDENYSLQNIIETLQVELIVDVSAIHPHVSWSHCAQRKIAS